MAGSFILGQPLASGAMRLISGNPWSGRVPLGGVDVKVDRSCSGSVYLGFSGNMTMNSGLLYQSGSLLSGLNDGFSMNPGELRHVPYSMLISGEFNLFVWCDVACSGLGRVYVDPIFAR